MSDPTDEVFLLDGESVHSLPARPMRVGLFGKTLEDALQTLLERCPQVIPGKQIDAASGDPPRFVLLRREMPIGNWSLDHLFVDQKAVLTLVETKLMQNPEARREVIGQAIEYAANASELWGNGVARQRATEYWSKLGKNLDEGVCQECGEDLNIEEFWSAVEENLQRGKIRIIIAADELRPEVRRMIEYVNAEMRNAEVLGLELKCYGKNDGSLVLVPRIIGQTQAITGGKPPGTGVTVWTEERLRNVYENLSDRQIGQRLLRVLDWAAGKGFFLLTTAKNASFGLKGRSGKRIITFFLHGAISAYLNEACFLNGAEQRNRFVEDLKVLRMYDRSFDPSAVVSNRDFKRKITEMDDEELEKLLEIIGKYCE